MRWSALPMTGWKRWWAWHRVRVGDEYVWLETVYRRGQYEGSYEPDWVWEYR